MSPKNQPTTVPASAAAHPEAAARVYGNGWDRPEQGGVPTQELDLAAIAELLRPHLDKQAKASRGVPSPPKGAPTRPNPRGGQHQAPGLGWSTATVVIVALIVLAVIVLGLGVIYAQLHGL